MGEQRKASPTDVPDDERAFVALVRPGAAQRVYDLREVFNGLRYLVKTGGQRRLMPHDLPPWQAVWQTVYERFRRWRDDGTWAAVVRVLQGAADDLG